MEERSAEPADPLDVLTEARRFLQFQVDLGGAYLPERRSGSAAEIPQAAPKPNHLPMADAPARTVSADPYERVAALIPEGHPVLSLHSLSEINQWVGGNVLIPIDAERINAVPGVGREDADLLIIGEAPGADEDRTGEPFVGRAGKLLNDILKAIGFEREDVYIANILKSRPPNNRAPLPDEVAAHLPILLRQISLIKPKVILCVGRSAGNGLLGRNESMKDLRAQFHDWHGIPLAVTYHPAALLRNPEWKRPTWEDVQMVRARYDELGGFTREMA